MTTTVEAAEAFLAVMAQVTTTCAACGEPCPAHPEGRGPVVCSVACFNRLSATPSGGSRLPSQQDADFGSGPSPVGITGEGSGLVAPHGKTRISASDSEGTRTCAPSSSATPCVIYPDEAAEVCGEADPSNLTGGECEHAADCRRRLAAKLPRRELTYTRDDPTTACTCPASVRATGQHSTACPSCAGAPPLGGPARWTDRPSLMRAAERLADAAAGLGDGADALWLASIADELRALALQLGEPEATAGVLS